MSATVETIVALIALLLIASVVLTVCKHYKFPYTVMLVLVGLLITQLTALLPDHLHHLTSWRISPDLIFYICLPALLFDSAFSMDPRQVKRDIWPILTLAIPGLLLSTLIIGFLVSTATHISFVYSLLLGAILSATDPIAVISVFKQLGASKRLTTLIEGESLFNDATSIVTAKILFTVILAGVFTGQQVWYGVGDFIFEFFGGILSGLSIAVIFGYILGFVESDAYIEISLTTVLVYGSFVVSQNVFHVSGVMATVAAGLTLTSWGYAKISPSVAGYMKQFWEYLAFVANSLIFLLVGLSVNVKALYQSFDILLIVIIAMLVSRAVIIYTLIPLVGRIPNAIQIDRRQQTVIYWGGLRGAIALAIVLSLQNFVHHELFVSVVTGAVLFTLLVQGLTIEKLVSWLRLDKQPLADRLAKENGKLSATKYALSRVPILYQGGMFSARIAGQLKRKCEKALERTEQKIEIIRKQELNPKEEEKLLILQCIATETKQYYEMFAKGHLSERAYRNLLDNLLSQSDSLRHDGQTELVMSLEKTIPLYTKKILSALDALPFAKRMSENIRASRVARSYEEYWGKYQGIFTVLKWLGESESTQIGKQKTINLIKSYYQKLQKNIRKRLDEISEHFPEFSTSMQERLAQRLILHAQIDALNEQATVGTLPNELAQQMKKDIEIDMYSLRERPSTKIVMDPTELLRKIPFFKDIPEDDFTEIAKLLQSRITSANEVIIREGEVGQSLFLIMRGVVRVSKRIGGRDSDIATLCAGDFFGEMALVHKEPRTATCRTITPCSLYEIKLSDFQRVKSKYPFIKAAIEKAALERMVELEHI